MSTSTTRKQPRPAGEKAARRRPATDAAKSQRTVAKPKEGQRSEGLRAEDRARLRELGRSRSKADKPAEPPRKKPARMRKPAETTAAKPKPQAGNAKPAKSAKPADKTKAAEAAAEPLRPAIARADTWHGRLIAGYETFTELTSKTHERVPTGPDQKRDGGAIDPADLASPRWLINLALDLLPDPPSHQTFIDIGSGRGRVVFEAARRPFEAVLGVENNPQRLDDAMLNLRHWPRSVMACRETEFLHADARRWKLPETDLVVYMFATLQEKDLVSFAQKLVRRMDQGHRITLLLLEPASTLPFTESPYFEAVPHDARVQRKLDLLSAYKLCVFKGHRPARATRPKAATHSRKSK